MDSSADNLAFDKTEEIVEYQMDNKIISPVSRRTSLYYGPFDSISMFSETTVPSEFAQIGVDAYETRKNQKSLEIESKPNNNIQYNLRFDKVVIVGGNEKKDVDIDKPVSNAVNEIITQRVNFNEIPLKYMTIDDNRFKKLLQRKAFYIPAILLILLLIAGLSFFLFDALSIEHQYGLSTLPPTKTTDTNPPTSTTESSNDSTTKFEHIHSYKVVNRSAWESNNDSLPITGQYKLISPVNKIILLNAITSQCETEEVCMEYMIEQQQNAYPDYDDIRENFIIALDGTIFEGRGFEREGMTTCESDKITCYSNKAISISFIKHSADDYGVNENQQLTFCQFIKDGHEFGSIDVSFHVFDHNKLISSSVDHDEFEDLKNCSDFHNIPRIERRNKTLENVDDDLKRRFSTKVIVTTTGGESYITKEDCSRVVQNYQEQNVHSANFIFCGSEYIFEDRNFDIAVNESLNYVLLIVVIGNYSTSPPSQSLITKLNNEFLEYSIVLGKLPRSHQICVTNEAQALINEMRKLNPTKYDNFCNETTVNE